MNKLLKILLLPKLSIERAKMKKVLEEMQDLNEESKAIYLFIDEEANFGLEKNKGIVFNALLEKPKWRYEIAGNGLEALYNNPKLISTAIKNYYRQILPKKEDIGYSYLSSFLNRSPRKKSFQPRKTTRI